MMKPSLLYQQAVQAERIIADPLQTLALQNLDRLWGELEHPTQSLWPFAKKTVVQGIYIDGPVGRGKTYLMDLFYEALTVPKLRLHFYEFMAETHVQLKMLQGHSNPLHQIATDLAKKARVLCLDEFFVEDIADAMILAAVLEGLLAAGVVMVMTSNVVPKDLYREGLQRDRFLPAIHLIETQMQLIDLNHPIDYRLLPHVREKLADGEELKAFDFAELCVKPRSSLDYLALTEVYRAILLQNVPALSDEESDAVRRFIIFIDICYDRKTRVILAAAVPLSELYQGKRLAFQFERTQSRLIEMAGWV